MKKIDFKKLFFYIIVTIGIGSLPALFINFKDSYNSFNKPLLSPPGIVFPIVWTILFILMAISMYRISNIGNLKKITQKNLINEVLFVLWWLQRELNQ